jgi:hypothetical protein
MASERWPQPLLEEGIHEGDPVADEVLTAIERAGDVRFIDELFPYLVKNDQLVASDFPQPLRDYLNQTDALPEWADPKRIAVGEEAFMQHGKEMILMLLCASLPTCYQNAVTSKVLLATQQLTKNVHRRIYETAQFLVDVMARGGLAPRGKGIRSAQKVRLMHASIRYYITHRANGENKWDAAWGIPISQLDLAFVLMTFSTTIIDGLERIGLKLGGEQEEAYFHAWNVVGHCLGVRQAYIPNSVEEGRALLAAIEGLRCRPSEDGRALTSALMDFMQKIGPGKLLPDLPASSIRYCIGDAAAEALGVQKSDWKSVLLLHARRELWHGTDELESHSEILGKVFGAISLAEVEALTDLGRGGVRPPFTIPTDLLESWR